MYGKLLKNNDENEKPRDLRQVRNVIAKQNKEENIAQGVMNSNSRCNFADEIQLLCSQVVNSDFVQAVFITKGHTPSVVLYSDEQVKDLKRFCTSNVADNMRSVLCVDRTFNLSSLFVTVTVFKHRAVLRKASNDHPLLIGPMLLHGDGQFSTYRQFFSHRYDVLCCDVAGTQIQMQESVLTGSDEEQALVKAHHYAFPTSTHVLHDTL